MIESDNGFSTFEGDYYEILEDLAHLVGSLKIHDFTIPDILEYVGLGLATEIVEPPNKEAKELLDTVMKRRIDAPKDKSHKHSKEG